VRLFEAAASGTPIISDIWDGLDTLLRPDGEVVLAACPEDVLDALLGWSEGRRVALANAARARVLAEHSAENRARSLETELTEAAGRQRFLVRRPALELGL
jgi:spore maturation protein CgeB